MKHPMHIDEAVLILRNFNAWRRYDGEGQEPIMDTPDRIGKAIDTACDMLDRYSASSAAKVPRKTK